MTESEDEDLTCPCCEYKTIGLEHEICHVCFWQCDRYQNTHPDDAGGPNRVSLREAQRNVAEVGAKKRKSVDRVDPPDEDDT